MKPPAYFEAIRAKAARRWEQLESDPELAGPWHQLFQQVQSPRHILSELLQNADDAAATRASVRIQDGVFVFDHDGEDFTEEHFSSLCRFGYSNKRALHTIGFRGVGFKSTFSLGERVELLTPSLSVSFGRQRFTEPRWLSTDEAPQGQTRIRVEICDHYRQQEVEKNLDEWLDSPVSLLFFKSLRRIRIGDREVRWASRGPGPVAGSEWIALDEADDQSFLRIRSDLQAFPEDALAEIRQERMLAADGNEAFPPCRVEIVLGAKGQLYVVLPTGVETETPFACNAPFVQDPARLKIKDPETSPTNRWLLERLGSLAASALSSWLDQVDLALPERAQAYDLLPDVARGSGSLEGVCATLVAEAFADAIKGQPVLLTEQGRMVVANGTVMVPPDVADVWPPTQAALLLDERGRPPLCQHVSAPNRKKLLRWGFVEELHKREVLEALRQKHLPQPESWRALMCLWAYVAPEITGWRPSAPAGELCIVPIQSERVLYSSREVVRLGEKRLLQSEEDWEYLAQHLLVLDQNWPRYLADQRRVAAGNDEAPFASRVDAAVTVMEKIGLGSTSDVSKVIKQVAEVFFSQAELSLPGCVRLTQIAAKLGARIGGAFRYATRDGALRSIEEGLVFDDGARLEGAVPEDYRDAHFLHSAYVTAFASCSRDDWRVWVSSGKAGLGTVPPIVERRSSFDSLQALLSALKRSTGYHGTPLFPYATGRTYTYQRYYLIDFDFAPELGAHWDSLSPDDSALRTVLELLLEADGRHWKHRESVVVEQTSTGGGAARKAPIEELLPASWLRRFSSKSCLPDRRGVYHEPADLLRRTAETESLIDVELFVDGRFDREATRPLLDLLGVRSTPSGPGRLLDRLRALSGVDEPPAYEVEKWYQRLDQMVRNCSTEDLQEIVHAFQSERLILAMDGTWARAGAVFLTANDDDVPGAALVRPSVRDMPLWRTVGVADRPTAERAIAWLRQLPTSGALPSDDVRRVRSLTGRFPVRIWEECACWLNLAGEWVAIDSLRYSLSMQSMTRWSHLHTWVKRKTADLQRVPTSVVVSPPFSSLLPLATCLKHQLQGQPSGIEQVGRGEWLRVFGTELRRISLPEDEETRRVRALANALARVRWVQTPDLETIPYVEGTPAATPQKGDVLWLDDVLYALPLAEAKLARRVPEEIGRLFARPDVKAALDYSYARSPAAIREYLEENFDLSAVDPVSEDAPVSVAFESSDEAVQTLNPESQRTGVSTEDADGFPPSSPPSDSEVEELENESHEDRDGGPLLPPRRGGRRLTKPGIIMERLARLQGFHSDGAGRFFHPNGSRIARSSDERSFWERRTGAGDLVCYYWPKDHCLELEPLQVGVDVWTLIEQHPETYRLVLSTADGDPVEVPGSQLVAMREEGVITLYPASYRLVYEEKQPRATPYQGNAN